MLHPRCGGTSDTQAGRRVGCHVLFVTFIGCDMPVSVTRERTTTSKMRVFDYTMGFPGGGRGHAKTM